MMTSRSARPRWLRGAGAVTAVAMVALAGSSAFGRPSRYTVQSGDTISALGRRFGVSQSALVEANHIADPNRIYAGDALVVPDAASTANGASSSGTKAPPVDRRTPGPLKAVTAPARGVPIYPADLLAHPARLMEIPAFHRWAAVYGVSPGLLESVAWMESGWQTSVVSKTGAVGVGQIEPRTAVFVSRQLLGLPATLDSRVPGLNIRMAAAYLAWLLRQTRGDVAMALAGYYEGLTTVRAKGPLDSTRRYVAGVGALWRVFRSG